MRKKPFQDREESPLTACFQGSQNSTINLNFLARQRQKLPGCEVVKLSSWEDNNKQLNVPPSSEDNALEEADFDEARGENFK